LTNAIYFKGTWADQFEKEHTEDSPFYVRPGTSVQVDMMYQKEDFRYADFDRFQALELPYVGRELSTLILLPKKKDGLAELENSLTGGALSEWLEDVRKQKVRVYLPRFKTMSEFILGDVLSSMGMSDAFSDPPADFSGMTGKKGLFMGAVVHKTFVDMGEQGTEAAAATSVSMIMEGVSRQPPPSVPVFRADHPFIFLIRDVKSGSILFMGRIVNPLK
jgi:serpin B